jgi:hypothetical protein
MPRPAKPTSGVVGLSPTSEFSVIVLAGRPRGSRLPVRQCFDSEVRSKITAVAPSPA